MNAEQRIHWDYQVQTARMNLASTWDGPVPVQSDVLVAVADELAASEAEVSRLRGALAPFAHVPSYLLDDTEVCVYNDQTHALHRLRVVDFKRARIALADEPAPEVPDAR